MGDLPYFLDSYIEERGRLLDSGHRGFNGRKIEFRCRKGTAKSVVKILRDAFPLFVLTLKTNFLLTAKRSDDTARAPIIEKAAVRKIRRFIG